MTTLLDLIDVDMPGRLTPQQRFNAFHKLNPQVYSNLESMTREMFERGRTRIGMGMLFEVLRWIYYMEVDCDPFEEFKLNNNYRSYYARLIMRKHPEWGQIFEIRSQHSPSRLVPR